MTKQPSILSPNGDLAQNLAQAEAIKLEMTKLLRQLETKAAGKSIAKPGGWRHHTSDWAEQHPPQNPPEQ